MEKKWDYVVHQNPSMSRSVTTYDVINSEYINK